VGAYKKINNINNAKNRSDKIEIVSSLKEKSCNKSKCNERQTQAQHTLIFVTEVSVCTEVVHKILLILKVVIPVLNVLLVPLRKHKTLQTQTRTAVLGTARQYVSLLLRGLHFQTRMLHWTACWSPMLLPHHVLFSTNSLLIWPAKNGTQNNLQRVKWNIRPLLTCSVVAILASLGFGIWAC